MIRHHMYTMLTISKVNRYLSRFYTFSYNYYEITQHRTSVPLAEEKMEEAGVIPDAIDNSPSLQLHVTYPGGEKVQMGKELTPVQVKDNPVVRWDGKPDKYYTLLMVDLDAPSRKASILGEINHWLVVNILGDDFTTGDVITEYAGAGPPKWSGLHRYVFLLFEHDGKLNFHEPRSTKTELRHRIRFNTRKFAKKYELSDPIAGNFFQAQWNAPVAENKRRCNIL